MISSIKQITQSHPFYDELLKHLDMRPIADLGTSIDYVEMMKDYNALPVGGFIGFLYYGKTHPNTRFRKRLTARGLRVGRSPVDDCSIHSLPVLSIESTALMAASNAVEISENNFDGTTAVDDTLPRRSEDALNSESLPLIDGVWQVYVLKNSLQKAKLEIKGRGRPFKQPPTEGA